MHSKLLGLFLFCAYACTATSKSVGDGFQLTTKALNEYLSSGVRPKYLNYALGQTPLPYELRADPVDRALDDTEVCLLCSLVADVLIMQRRMGMSEIHLAGEAAFFCSALKIENERVCEGIIRPNVNIFTYIVDNNEALSGHRICGLLLPEKNCDVTNYEWTINVPSGETVDKVKANGTNKFNILHISDIHYDPLYTPGKSKECGEPLCCQVDQADGADASDSCGYWSEYYHADTPLYTVEETFKQMATHEFDYVICTGDFVSHRVWSTSAANNSRDITAVTDLFKKYFDVPVYPVLGNHEPHPVNTWSSEGVDKDASVSTQWVFELAAEQWGGWLTDVAKTTILKGGYYAISPKEGLRVVVLNNNVCYTENWWLIDANKDPYEQLTWLAEVLLEAEKKKESVHLLMHMPVGTGSCLASWSREYARLINRFSNTITGQFTGHSHKDEMWVYYSKSDPSKPISVSWNGASLNADKSNPSYKLYEIDAVTFDVLDFEEWTFNLTQANLDATKELEWYKLYSFKDAYGVESLEPSEVDELITRMTKDHSLIQKYYNFKYRNSDVANREGCDEDCEKALLCNMVTTEHADTEHCDKLERLYDENK